MSANGYTLNIPVQINGGEGKPATLLPRELYFDSTNKILYCGDGNNNPVAVELYDLVNKVKTLLENEDTKTINKATLESSFIQSYSGVVNNFSELANKDPGLYFVKVES